MKVSGVILEKHICICSCMCDFLLLLRMSIFAMCFLNELLFISFTLLETMKALVLVQHLLITDLLNNH